jgi:hypothetical protein
MVGEDRRSCIVIILEKSPDSVKTICEVVDSERINNITKY